MNVHEERELRFIGSVMIDREAFEAGIAAELKPDDFSSLSLGRIWKAAIDCGSNEGDAVDIVTIAERLHSDGDLAKCGNITSLQEIMTAVATTAYATIDARKIRERGIMRRGAREGEPLVKQAVKGEADRDEIRGWAENYSQNLAPKPNNKPESISEILNRLGDNPVHDVIPSGIEPLDEKIGGFLKGSLVVFGGKPGAAKTSILLDIARYTARNDHSTHVYSLEMSREEIVARICAQESGISANRILSGDTMTADEMINYVAGRANIAVMDLTLHESPALSIVQLKRDMDVATPRPRVVILDYLQQMSEPLKMKTHEAISLHVRELKRIARALHAVVIVASQFTREGERSEDPAMTDLHGSSEIEKAADLVLLLTQPNGDEEARILKIEKNRHGPKGKWRLPFYPALTTFRLTRR